MPSILVAPRIEVPVTSALVAWVVLLGVALAALLGLAMLARWQDPASRDRPGWPPRRPGPPPRRPRWRSWWNAWRPRRRWPSSADCARWAADAAELVRDAAATARRADEAAADEAQARLRRAEARQATETAERELHAAQRAHDEALAAWRAGEAERAARVRSAAEERREHEVSRAALGAYRRGDLSVDDLREVFRRTGGWDPVQEQRGRESVRLGAEVQRRQRAYDVAVAAERIADEAASVAEVAARALVEEAAQTARDARSARAMAEECLRARRYLGLSPRR